MFYEHRENRREAIEKLEADETFVFLLFSYRNCAVNYRATLAYVFVIIVLIWSIYRIIL